MARQLRVGELTLTIKHDMYPDSPLEWDMLGKFILSHDDYVLGHDHNYNFRDFIDGMELEEKLSEEYMITEPISLYDHSGISISRGIAYGWDSSFIGFFCLTEKDVELITKDKETKEEKNQAIDDHIDSVVNLYDKYLRGQVYSILIEKNYYDPIVGERKVDVLDSLSGIYEDITYNDNLISFLKEGHFEEKTSNIFIDYLEHIEKGEEFNYEPNKIEIKDIEKLVYDLSKEARTIYDKVILNQLISIIEDQLIETEGMNEDDFFEIFERLKEDSHIFQDFDDNVLEIVRDMKK